MHDPFTDRRVKVTQFPLGNEFINKMMPFTRDGLDKYLKTLGKDLFGVRFQSTLRGHGMVRCYNSCREDQHGEERADETHEEKL